MENIKDITKYDKQFYPTPKSLACSIASSLDFRFIKTILEPSAGKGDFLKAIAMECNSHRYEWLDIDCIEIDPYLREILKYNFGKKKNDTLKEIEKIKEELGTNCIQFDKEKNLFYRYGTERSKIYLEKSLSEKYQYLLEEFKKGFFENGIHIVYDDFLKYESFKKYDLIIMNPPFLDGDKHLLKAIDMQKDGGNIVCILNAETIRNPYTKTRQILVDKLKELNATIDYVDNAFKYSERKADVEVAVIKISIQEAKRESDIYKNLKEAEKYEECNFENKELTFYDKIKAIISQYNLEVRCGIELIKQYKRMIPHMLKDFREDCDSPILNLCVGRNSSSYYENINVNSYLIEVRRKYWETFMKNKELMGRLTSKLQEQYFSRVEELVNYEFSEFNIKNIIAEMNSNIMDGIEKEIYSMFDTLSCEHAYYSECSNNVHYYDGWKTNKAHKINNRVIIPCYGIYESWSNVPNARNGISAVEDIERVLNFLSGDMSKNVNLGDIIVDSFNRHITKKIELKYFFVTFYKKGTMHITFKDQKLIDRFNTYAAKQRNWLPPSYGNKHYKDMEEEEKIVVDNFQGEKDYEDKFADIDYYLSSPTNNIPLLGGV